MRKQSRDGRKARRGNWPLENINKVLSIQQPVPQSKAQGNDGRIRQAERTGSFRHSRENQRGGRGRDSSNDERFGTLPQQPQGAAPSLLQRMTRDGIPMLTSKVEQSYSGQGKRKRGDTQERDLNHDDKQRSALPGHDTLASRGTPDGKYQAQAREHKHKNKRFDSTKKEVEVQKNAQKKENGNIMVQAATDCAPRGPRAALPTRMTWDTQDQQQKKDKWTANKGQQKSISTEQEANRSMQQPQTTSNLEKAYKILVSSPARKGSPANAKRKIEDVDEPAIGPQKKQRVNDSRMPTSPPQKKKKKKQQSPQKPGREPRVEDAFAVNPVVANLEFLPTFKEYDDDSVPIMMSEQIQHMDSPDLLNDPSPQLKANAFILLKRGLNTKDLGRKPPKDANGNEVKLRGRVKVIEDIDLYLHEDGKLYVATDLGLLVVADYLTLAGYPDTQPVRFNGMKPAWVGAVIARADTRRTIKNTQEPDWLREQTNRHPKEILPDVPEGDLGLTPHVTVNVYFQDYETGRAFGQRVDLNETGKHYFIGWFDMKNVGDYLPLDSDWEGLYIEEDLVAVTQKAKTAIIPPTEKEKLPSKQAQVIHTDAVVPAADEQPPKIPEIKGPKAPIPQQSDPEVKQDTEKPEIRPEVDAPIQEKAKNETATPPPVPVPAPAQRALYNSRDVEDEVDWDDDDL
ncbi:hypothetical protein SNOG_11694 [Parastagonospora nodorum SN15]|uniref:Uncharacterized protein n=1 Tax=Phaeosphaeria nodorum (strain SN15 / ATCC MYA-4574 / FGSC 10173) TaxID=321614 RepID=Q0U970_PHANO|nr:hypothetical protein SNOG_11694 [Parastagonospora nodorum SN15]EAT80738.2 hypothetical protein SNOG_11694 [Parastagonospora nodorum SN15]